MPTQFSIDTNRYLMKEIHEMNVRKKDFSKATFQLKIEDLDRPESLLKAYRCLHYEVWRYSKTYPTYYLRLPPTYVHQRLADQLRSDIPYNEKLLAVERAMTALRELGIVDCCPAIGDFVVKITAYEDANLVHFSEGI